MPRPINLSTITSVKVVSISTQNDTTRALRFLEEDENDLESRIRRPLQALTRPHPAQPGYSRLQFLHRLPAYSPRDGLTSASLGVNRSRGISGTQMDWSSFDRHFTHGLLHFLVRDVCVRRAARVISG